MPDATAPRLIIDSHLDLAWNALQWNRDLTEPIEQLNSRERAMTDRKSRGRATVCLPELRRGGLAVVLGTILSRAKREVIPTEGFSRINIDFATQEIASSIGQGQLAHYNLLAARNEIRFIRTAKDLDAHWKQWITTKPGPFPGLGPTPPIGYLILAMEGADPIIDPSHAEWWFNHGLRVLGLAHYGKSHYAVGTGDSGPLTEKGIALLREMQRLGIILDLTHSSDPSFFQALDIYDGPVLASHNNCRAIVPGDRQYRDEQIRKLVARGAVIGVAFDAWMLYPGWVLGKNRSQCRHARCGAQSHRSRLPTRRQHKSYRHRYGPRRWIRQRAGALGFGDHRRLAKALADASIARIFQMPTWTKSSTAIGWGSSSST